MKKIILAAIILLSVSCKSKKADLSKSEGRSDTVYLESYHVIHDTAVLQLVTDSVRDVIRIKDSALFEANFKLARVWYYDSLCLINKNNQQFLTGWIRRALEK
jgi:hypothetical protein